MTFKEYYTAHLAPAHIAKHPYSFTIWHVKNADGSTWGNVGKESIVRGSIKLTQALCSEDYFLWGGCNASKLEFEVKNEKKFKDSPPYGDIILSIYPHDENDETESNIDFFTGTIESTERGKVPGAWKVVAYDHLYFIRNAKVTDAFDQLLATTVAAGNHLTWYDCLYWLANFLAFSETSVAAIQEDWMKTCYIPDSMNADSVRILDLLKEFAFFSKAFYMIDGSGTLQKVTVQDSLTGSTGYLVSLYDPEKLDWSGGYVWKPGLFVSAPPTNIFYRPDQASGSEAAYANLYTISGSNLLGDQDWIEKMYDCDEYGTPSSAYSSTNMPVGLYDTSRLCLSSGETYSQQQYSLEAYMDPSIPMGSVISIQKDGAEIVRSYIMERTITFESTQGIKCKISAQNGPYNSTIPRATLETNKLRASVSALYSSIPGIHGISGGVSKLKAVRALSKIEYEALSEKRDDTLYYVYEETTS